MDDILEGSAGGARSYGGNETNCWLVVLRTGDYQWLGVSHCLLRREGGGGLMETGISSRFESSGVVSRLLRKWHLACPSFVTAEGDKLSHGP